MLYACIRPSTLAPDLPCAKDQKTARRPIEFKVILGPPNGAATSLRSRALGIGEVPMEEIQVLGYVIRLFLREG